MVTHGRVELLAHPLSQKYLQMKWNSYGKYFHLANLLFYCIFLSFVTIFAAQLMDDNSMNTTETKDVNSTHTGSHNMAKQEVLMRT
jgi:transient receptor potential cation channel subfamily A protein 1